MYNVKKGTVASVKKGDVPGGFALQVRKLTRVDEKKYRHECTDGVDSIGGLMVSEPVLNLIHCGAVQEGSVIRVKEFRKDGEGKLNMVSVEVLGFESIKSSQGNSKGGVVQGQENREAPKSWKDDKTPERRGSTIQVASATPFVTPLEALNPYGDWKVKVKVSMKTDMKSFTQNGQSCSLFSAEVVDENGTQAEVTFWKEQADKYYDALKVDKVYILSKFSVKPANKRFSSLAFHYALHIDKRSVVEECADQDTSKMKEQLEITKIGDLQRYLGRQVPVSVMGVVVSTGKTGTVKRKKDDLELVRRDISIMDKSFKSVTLTCWDKLAEAAAKLEDMVIDDDVVVAVSACRVTDFNGLSLNSTKRSFLTISPDTEEAKELKTWYRSEGYLQKPKPIGEGLRTTRQTVQKRKQLKDIQPKIVPSPDAKAQYGVVNATIIHINPDQAMVYLANTENNKKVVEQGGNYFCETDGKTYYLAEYRYVMTMKVADCTGETWITVFNDQAKEILGVSAKEMFEMKNSDQQRYRAALSRAQWKPYLLRTASKSRPDLKTQEVKMRHSVAALHSFDVHKECNTLLQQIAHLKKRTVKGGRKKSV